MKKVLTTLVVILLVISLVLTGIVTGKIPNFLNRTPVQVTDTTQVLKEAFKDTNELYVENYIYDMKSERTEPWTVAGKTIVTEGNKLIYLFSGTLKVGVDMSKADIRAEGNKITFTFPEWISLNTFDNTVEPVTVRKLTLSQKDLTDWAQKYRDDDEETVLARAKENGTYDKAKESLKNDLQHQVNGILRAAGVTDGYEVEVVIEDEEPVITETEED